MLYVGFAVTRARKCAEKPAIRSTLSAEIRVASKAREAKGWKLFQKDRLLENPNNVPPTASMTFVVSDIREVMSQSSRIRLH